MPPRPAETMQKFSSDDGKYGEETMSAMSIERQDKALPVLDQELQQLEQLWERPSMGWDGDDAEQQEWVVFVVLGLGYAAALAYAAYCTSRGGHPDISFGWKEFKVACNK